MLDDLLGERMAYLQSEDLSQLISIVIIMRSGHLREAASRINDIFHEKQKVNGLVNVANSETHQAVVRTLYYLLNACKLFQAKRVLQRADIYMSQGNLLRAEEYYLRVESLTNEGGTFLQAVHNRALCTALRQKNESEYFEAVEGFYRTYSGIFPVMSTSSLSSNGNSLENLDQSPHGNRPFSTLELAAVASGLHYVACMLVGRVQHLLRLNQSDNNPLYRTLRIETNDEQTRRILKFCRNKLQKAVSSSHFSQSHFPSKSQQNASLSSGATMQPTLLILAMRRLQEVCDLLLLLSESRLIEAEGLIERVACAMPHQMSIPPVSPNVSQPSVSQPTIPVSSPQLSPSRGVSHQQVLVLLQQSQSVLQRLRSHFLQSVTNVAQSPTTIDVTKNNPCKIPQSLTPTLSVPKSYFHSSMPIVLNSAANNITSVTGDINVTSDLHSFSGLEKGDNIKESVFGSEDAKKQDSDINASKNIKAFENINSEEVPSQHKSDSNSALQPPDPVNKPARPSLNTIVLPHNSLKSNNRSVCNTSLTNSFNYNNMDSNNNTKGMGQEIITNSSECLSCKPQAPTQSTLPMASSSKSSFLSGERKSCNSSRDCVDNISDNVNNQTASTRSVESEDSASISERKHLRGHVRRPSLAMSPVSLTLSLPASVSSPVVKMKPTSMSVAHLPAEMMSIESNMLRHSCPPLFLSLTPRLGHATPQPIHNTYDECDVSPLCHETSLYPKLRSKVQLNANRSYVSDNDHANVAYDGTVDFNDEYHKRNVRLQNIDPVLMRSVSQVSNERFIIPQPGAKSELLWSDVLRRRASLRHVDMDDISRRMHHVHSQDDHSVDNSSSDGNRYDAIYQSVDPVYRYPVPLSLLLAPGPYPPHVPPHCREAFLSDVEFVRALGVDKGRFYELPHWKQVELKRRARLF